MKTQCTNQSKWLAFGCWLALLAAGAAQAQVLVPVQQPCKSPNSVNVYFSNISVTPRDEKTAEIQFDIGWAGSWRTDVNHDAAWVFFKYRLEGDETRTWRHVRLAADKVLNPTGYGQGPAPAGEPLSFDWGCSPTDRKKFTAAGDTQFDFLVPDGDDGFAGAFVRRADHGMGMASGAKLTVLWDLRGLDVKKDTKVAIKAYGIKMVYVAEGAFDLGSGGTETGAFYAFQPEKQRGAEKDRITAGGATMVIHEAVDATVEFPPYRVTSSNAIPTGKVPGKLWARAAEPPDGGEIPATFPTGYRAFYMMDRPIPQAVYACFLSSVPPDLAAEYHEKGGHATEGGWAGFIGKFQDPDNPYEFHHGRLKSTCTWWLSWEIGTSFAAWAGLRPMTELENEKALRGPRMAAPEECGSSFWGGSYGGGRYNAHPREMEVTVATTNGLAFKGTHGNGSPTNWPADWPNNKTANGTGIRNGQEAACGITELRGPFWCTSCRLEANLNDPERNKIYGFRGARTAPEKAKWNSVRDEEEASPVLQGLPAVR
jgi:hypothetical protein